MVLKYTWLKVLDVLKKHTEHTARVSIRELRVDLDSRGFRVEERELADDLAKMRDLGLIDTDLLVTSDGSASTAIDDYSTLGITSAGLRKLSGIVKI